MRKFKFYSLFIIAALAFTSCAEEEVKKTNTSSEKIEDNKDKVCLYKYDPRTTELGWEAYKTTDKVAVKGKLTDVSMKTPKNSAETIADLFTGSMFKVMTTSVDSDNQERDDKIRNFFFGNLNEGDMISGSVKSVNGDETKGSMYMALTMSKVTNDVLFNYEIDEKGVMTVEGVIDLLSFDAEPAVTSLNNKCDELHKGMDGISKLWSEVKVSIVTELAKDCR